MMGIGHAVLPETIYCFADHDRLQRAIRRIMEEGQSIDRIITLNQGKGGAPPRLENPLNAGESLFDPEIRSFDLRGVISVFEDSVSIVQGNAFDEVRDRERPQVGHDGLKFRLLAADRGGDFSYV